LWSRLVPQTVANLRMIDGLIYKWRTNVFNHALDRALWINDDLSNVHSARTASGAGPAKIARRPHGEQLAFYGPTTRPRPSP
jgi:hypothetical protein